MLIVLVMRMLGEMAVANPQVGSFMEYCRTALGPRAGFTVGWLYWYFWAIVLAIEAVAGATILQHWLPTSPMWLMSLILMTLLTATNLWSVQVLRRVRVLVRLDQGRRDPRLHRSSAPAGCSASAAATRPACRTSPAHDGFFPEGGVTVLSGIVIVIFAFVGAEIVTIAAAESDEPERAVAQRRPTRSSAA